MSDTGFDWQAFFFDPSGDWPARLLAHARKRFGDGTFAEEADTWAIERLSGDDWARLKEYDGKARPATFLFAAYNNALIDYHRSRYGRVRPPEWLKRLGVFWKEVFQLLCIKRWPREQIIDRFCVSGERLREDVLSVISTIHARIPDCGAWVGESTLDEREGVPDPLEAARPAAAVDSELDAEVLGQVLLALSALLDSETHPAQAVNSAATSLRSRIDSIRACISLEPEERLVLRMVYQDCYKVAKAARLLGRPEHQVRNTLKRTLKRLRQCLESAGFTPELLV